MVVAFIQDIGDAGMDSVTDLVAAGGLPYSLYYSSFLSFYIPYGANMELNRFLKKVTIRGSLFCL